MHFVFRGGQPLAPGRLRAFGRGDSWSRSYYLSGSWRERQRKPSPAPDQMPRPRHQFAGWPGCVHTGVAFVGATGLGTTVDDFTALGDAVNITARLASAAVAGEVIVSVATAEAAGMATGQLERRTVEIRGRTEPIEVIVLPAARQKVSPDEPHI